MKDVAVVAYCRTGIARAVRGALNQTHGIPMTAHVLRHAVQRAGVDPAEVEDVVIGCGLPEMSGIRYLGSPLLELGRRSARRAIVGVCTAGGMATAAYLERS